jgi:hypothetical protein
MPVLRRKRRYTHEPKSKRILALLNDPGQKKRLLEALNKDTMDAAAPIGNGEMTILKDMESLNQEHEQYMQDLKGGSHVE